MKTRITISSCISIFILIVSGCATTYGPKAPKGMNVFERLIEVPNQNKDEIYVKANSWLVKTFDFTESDILFQDKDAGKIMGKLVHSYGEGLYLRTIRQTLDITIKDETLKLVINDPYFKTKEPRPEGGPVETRYRPLDSEGGLRKARAAWRSYEESLTEYLLND